MFPIVLLSFPDKHIFHLIALVGVVAATVLTSLRTALFHVDGAVAAAIAVVEEVVVVDRRRIDTGLIQGSKDLLVVVAYFGLVWFKKG